MNLKIVFFVSLFSINQSLFSQIIDLKFVNIPNAEKLSSSFTTCIAQDSVGFIWIGTQDGLNKFDGYDISVYKNNNRDTSSLPGNNIKTLFTDNKGRLWISTTAGICIFSYEHNNFLRIAHEGFLANMDALDVNDIKEGPSEQIYVANYQKIYRYSEINKTFIEVLKIEKGEISSFVFDNNFNIWISALKNGGLFYYNRKTNQINKYKHEPGNNNTGSNSIAKIVLRENFLWIATADKGISRLNIRNKTIKKYLSEDPYARYSSFCYVDKTDRLWTCDVTGIKLYDDNSDTFLGYYNNKEDEFSIKESPVAIFQDRQKNYWTIYSPGGIGFRMVPRGFILFDGNPSKFWHTSSNNISAICEDEEGNLWLGNPYNGIDIFCWQKGQTISYNYNSKDKYCLGEGATQCIFRDKENIMWIGTNLGGLQYFNKKNAHFVSFLHDPLNPNSIANNDVRSISEDGSGNLWLVTQGKGIDKYNKNTGVFHHYNQINNNLSNDYVFDILCDSKGNVWAGTVWGLSRLKKGENTFENYYHSEDDSASLSNNEINCIYEDELNRIWIGTVHGLNLYQKKTNDFKRFTKGFNHTHISSILSDKNNTIWVSTLGGLTLLDPENGETHNFDESDGLQSNEFNPNSGYKNNNNALFFGGIKGLTIFNPDELLYNNEKPKIIFSKFELFYEEVTANSINSVLDKHISATKEIILNYYQNVITFEFLAINMIQPEKNQYACMMEGFDKGWNFKGPKREITYTNLNPGKYIFKVIASNNDGVWNYEGASLKIIIKPPWWKTLWFNALLIIFITSIILFIYFYRINLIKKQKRKLEKEVEVRTKELENAYNELVKNQNKILLQNEEIKQKTEELSSQADHLKLINIELEKLNSTKDKLFSIIAHDLRSPFNTILGFSSFLSEKYNTITDEERIKIAKSLNKTSTNAFYLLENLLQWAGSQTNKVQYKPKIFNLTKVIKENIDLMRDSSDKKNIHIQFNINPEICAFGDVDMVKCIIRNLLNNAIKFTPKGGIIIIETEILKDYIKISVKDSGIGMSREQIVQLFEIKKDKSIPGTDGEKGFGLGLLLCKDFVEKNKGNITVESNLGAGTKISFTLPADNF
ncbi:MAG: hypothetical protein JXB17_12475 [Bacteroidales bacterium]|nr:hypothetical protein [Bacteroidales bacterium]